MAFYPEDFSQFIVTGRFHNSDRHFRQVYAGTYAGAITAMGINLWRGHVWGVRKHTGKRKLLKRVFN